MNSRISRSGIPICTRCGGSPRISPNCRFEQISCKSASNTAMPCRTWLSAVCNISRLKCNAAWESSSSLRAALAETVRLRSNSDITRREDAAPIEEAIRCSACCSSSKSAGRVSPLDAEAARDQDGRALQSDEALNGEPEDPRDGHDSSRNVRAIEPVIDEFRDGITYRHALSQKTNE